MTHPPLTKQTSNTAPVPSVAWEERAQGFVAQRQAAIRMGESGLLVLIAFALATFLYLAHNSLSTIQTVIVLATAIGFAGWSLWGTRRIHAYFQQGYRADEAPTQLLGQSRGEALAHFVGQYAMIVLLFGIAVNTGELRFLWLFLLVPVAHAALFLPMWTAALAYLTSVCILGCSACLIYGPGAIAVSWMQFSLAAMFVFVFAQIAASAEKGRAEVAFLASELTTLNRQLSQYSVQAEELAVTRERNELARNIHDSVGHVLTAVNIQLRAAQALIDNNLGSAHEAINRAQELSAGGLAEIRNSVTALRESPLKQRPLHEAIADMFAGESNFGFATSFSVSGEPRSLPQPVAIALYRATQEGITNVHKHTEATQVEIQLDYQQVDSVSLTIHDDGTGGQPLSGGFGLLGLRERAELLGGGLTVRWVPSGGVELKMRLPG